MRLVLTCLVGLTLGLPGCAGKKQPRPAIGIYRLTRCAKNDDHFVCDCKHWHQEVNAKNGELIMQCD